MNNTMRTTVGYNAIWKIAYPIMLGNLAQTLIALTDTAFLGRVGEVELGASAMASIFYYVFSTLAWGFSVGIQVIVARRVGEGNFKKIGVIFEHGLVFVSILSILLFAIMKLFSGVILDRFIGSPNIYAAAMDYLAYRPYGIIFVCFNFLYRSLYIGLSKTKVMIYTTSLMAIVNFVLNWVLIFGNLGAPALGIKGAAIASVTAEISATIFFTVYTIKKLPLQKYTLFYFHRLETWLMGSILKVSLPTMGQKLLSFGTWFLFFALVENMGERPVAVSMIVRSAYMFMITPVFAFAATANALTSRLMGEQRSNEVRSLLWEIIRLNFICITPILIFSLLAPGYMLGIYTDNSQLITASIPSLYMLIAAAIIMSFGSIFFEAVSGTGNTAHALILEIGVLALYIFTAWYFATVVATNVEYVWSAESVYGGVLALVCITYMYKFNWRRARL